LTSVAYKILPNDSDGNYIPPTRSTNKKGKTMSVTVLLEVLSKPESIDELKQTLKAILPDTRSYDGCISVQVVLNQDDPLNLILNETWESRAHYEKYFAWRAETGGLEALGKMLSASPSVRYFDHQDI
jgi:quinol monooxygenase YgiN